VIRAVAPCESLAKGRREETQVEDRATTEARKAGAMEELARDPSSRKRFLKLVGGAGAASAFAVFLAACGDDDDEEEPQPARTQEEGGATDLAIVQYALTLEHLETDFYNAVIDAGAIEDAALADTAKAIRDNEQEHVDALTQVVEQLGGTPERPRTTFDAVIEGGPDKILQTAAEVENLGAAAYLGQAGRIQSKEILASALAIHSVEARHAAALNRVVGKTIVPDGAFARPASMEEVLPKVQPFLAQ
jgi:rubrerythrin